VELGMGPGNGGERGEEQRVENGRWTCSINHVNVTVNIINLYNYCMLMTTIPKREKGYCIASTYMKFYKGHNYNNKKQMWFPGPNGGQKNWWQRVMRNMGCWKHYILILLLVTLWFGCSDTVVWWYLRCGLVVVTLVWW
jgi:hypothetical protein